MVDSFTGTDGTNIVSHTANTGQSWSLSGGFTNKIKIQGNTAQLASGADANNWRMAITTDVAHDTFDLWTDYRRGSQNVLGDYAQLEFLAKSGPNPPTDRVYVAFTRASASVVTVRLVRTLNFSNAQSIMLDTAFALATGTSKRIGATVAGLSVQVWWEPAGGGTRTNIGSAVTLTADYRDGLHKRVAFSFVGAQAWTAGSPWIDNFVVAKPAPPDTSRPAVPAEMNLPETGILTAASPDDSTIYFRNVVVIAFGETVSGVTARAILAKYGATIIGGAPFIGPWGAYVVQVPDPGATLGAVDSLVSQIESETSVAEATWLTYRGLAEPLGRYPVDGPQSHKPDWAPNGLTDATRSRVAVRATLGWGCETGTYGVDRPNLGIVDGVFPIVHPDFAGSTVQLHQPPNATLQMPFLQNAFQRSHGIAVAGVLSATGDNQTGVAGMVWGANLHLYALGQGTSFFRDPIARLRQILAQARLNGNRVLGISYKIGPARDRRAVAMLRRGLRSYLASGSGNVVVLAMSYVHSQPGVSVTLQQLQTTNNIRFGALLKAAAQLYDSLPGQIIFVAGVDNSNHYWDESDYVAGATVIAAPAVNVTTLANPSDFSDGLATGVGTSFAQPFVSGVAAELLASDPQLSGSELSDYIARGSRLPRWNSGTQQTETPQPLTGGAAQPTAYLLDAYGALSLHASEHVGVPLCANRVWRQNNELIAERDPTLHTIEHLIDLGEPTTSFVNVRHGGRRIDVSTDLDDHFYEFQQGHWAQTQNAPTTGSGGTWLSMQGASHDGDTLIMSRYWTSADTAFFEHTIRAFNPFADRVLDTLALTLSRFTDGECIRRTSSEECNFSMPTVGTEERVIEHLAYAPRDTRIYAAVTYLVTRLKSLTGWQPCPAPPGGDASTCRSPTYEEVAERTEFWEIDLQSASQTQRWTSPSGVDWFGISEEGGQVVSGESVLTTRWTWQPRDDGSGFDQVWSNPGTLIGCGFHYRDRANGSELRPPISTPAGEACVLPIRGKGTIAPTPIFGRKG